MLDHFGQAGRQLARRQGFQGRSVGDHGARLVEGADHVLAQRVVDARLAADGGIDLRQQGGGHLHEADAAHVAGRRIAGQVADHAAAQRHQGGLAVAFIGQQRVEDLHQAGPVFIFFAVRQDDADHFAAIAGQRRLQAAQVQRRDGGIGDDGHLVAADMAQQRIGVGQQAGTDGDRVAAFVEVYAQQHFGLLVHRRLCMNDAVGRGLAFEAGQLHQDGLNHRLYVRTARVDHNVGHFQIVGLALRRQFFQLLARVGRLQQGAVLVVAGARQDVADAGAQVHDRAPLLQVGAAVGVEDGPATGGHDDAFLGAQVTDDLGFAPAKAGLALDFKDPRDGRSRACLDFVVGIDKAQAQLAGQDAPDRGFACAHEADKKDITVRNFGHYLHFTQATTLSCCCRPVAPLLACERQFKRIAGS